MGLYEEPYWGKLEGLRVGKMRKEFQEGRDREVSLNNFEKR